MKRVFLLFILMSLVMLPYGHAELKHELGASANAGMTYFDSDFSDASYLVSIGALYSYRFSGRWQVRNSFSTSYASFSSGASNFQLSYAVGPQYNFSLFQDKFRFENSYFAFFSVRFNNLLSNNFDTSTDLDIGFGKRIPIINDSITWNPSITLSAVNDLDDFRSISLNLFSLSVLF